MSLQQVLSSIHTIARTIVRDNAERTDVEGRWPVENLRALQQARLAGLVIPKGAGGLGLGLGAVAHVCEELGQECASTAIAFGMHLVGSAVLAAKATPSQRSRFLEPIARGEHLTTLALSEPGTGVHFYLPQTAIRRTDRGFALEGVKSFVTNGGFADSYVVSGVPARADAAPGEFSCVVVRQGAPGMTWLGTAPGWGLRGNAARSVRLDQVEVPVDDLLGEEGDQIWFVFKVVAPYFLIAMAATYLGVATSALERARVHVLARSHAHTGVTLAENPIIQHRLGELWAELHRTRALIYAAAALGDAGDPDALCALCAAKAEVAQTAEHVTSEAMTLVGGRGYGEGHPLQRLYRDARAAHVMSPTTDLLRTWSGRAYLGLPILAD